MRGDKMRLKQTDKMRGETREEKTRDKRRKEQDKQDETRLK